MRTNRRNDRPENVTVRCRCRCRCEHAYITFIFIAFECDIHYCVRCARERYFNYSVVFVDGARHMGNEYYRKIRLSVRLHQIHRLCGLLWVLRDGGVFFGVMLYVYMISHSLTTLDADPQPTTYVHIHMSIHT